MEQRTPLQYSKFGSLLKSFLHTRIGAAIGYYAGISGFNRIDAQVAKFQGPYNRPLKRGEFTRFIGDTQELGIYRNQRAIFSFNARVDKGAALTASLLSNTALGSISSPSYPVYIALSTATLTPAKTDTTLTSETVVAGLTRAIGTVGNYTAPSVLDGAASYTLSKVFTLTGTSTTIVSAAIFDAASVGNMFVEANLSSSAAMSTGDQLTITWTINL